MDAPGNNLVMLPRDAPTDVLNELQLVQEFYGADTAADHQRVMALFAPNAQLDLPQMFVRGRDNISAIMFYAKSFIADVDIEPYMVEIATGCSGANGIGPHYTGAAHTTSGTAPTSSTTSTDSTGSTCTSAATSKRRRAGKPPKAPSAAAAGPSSNGNGSSRQQPSRLGRKQDPHRPPGGGRSRHHGGHSDATTATDQQDGGATAQNNHSAHHLPESMSQTHVYAVATITPKSLLRMVTLNLLPREIHIRTRVTLVWDDEAGEVLVLQERPDNLPVGLVPGVLKRAVGKALGYVSTRSQWLIGRVSRTRLVAHRWPGLARLHGTGI